MIKKEARTLEEQTLADFSVEKRYRFRQLLEKARTNLDLNFRAARLRALQTI